MKKYITWGRLTYGVISIAVLALSWYIDPFDDFNIEPLEYVAIVGLVVVSITFCGIITDYVTDNWNNEIFK